MKYREYITKLNEQDAPSQIRTSLDELPAEEIDEAYVEYRGKYYDVIYDVRTGYVAVGKGPYKNQIKRRSFTKLDDAKEHAELELDLD